MSFSITPDGVKKSTLACAVASELCRGTDLPDQAILAAGVSISILSFDAIFVKLTDIGLGGDEGAAEQLYLAMVQCAPGLAAKALEGGPLSDFESFATSLADKAAAVCSAVGF